MNIAPSLAAKKHECKRKPRFRADRPTLFKRSNLSVGPRADFLSFRSLDAE
jgi:hypothetical protein